MSLYGRKPTKKEKEWCDKMRELMDEKPLSITLFCNGRMCVLCSKAVDKAIKRGGAMPQPLEGIPSLGFADGGDF